MSTARLALNRLLQGLPLAISLGLLALIAVRFEGYGIFAEANVALFLGALVVSLSIATALGAWKWWRVVQHCGIEATYGEIWGLWTGLLPATFVAPFQSGHLLYVVAIQRAKDLPLVRATECVAYDKWLSLIGTFVLIGVGWFFLPADHVLHHVAVPLVAWGAVGFFAVDHLAFGLLARIPALRETSTLLQRPIALVPKLRLLGLATLYQASDTISMYLGCRALGLDVDPGLIAGAFPVILLLTYVPISFSGFGVRENLVVVFFGASLTYDEAIAAGLTVDFLEYVGPAIFGVVALPYLIARVWRRTAAGEPSTGPEGPDPG